MKLFKIIILVILFIPLSSFSQEKNLFKSSKQSFVVKSDTIDLDNYNHLIIIPGGRMFRKFFEKIAYFKEVVDYDTFYKGVEAANITEDDGSPIKTDAYKKYYKKYKPFLVLNLVMGKNNLVEFNLLKPDTGEIFIVRNKSVTSVIGISAGTNHVYEETWNSMMNEFVNYIRANSKSYNK